MKTLIDYINPDRIDRYNELLAEATENKKNAPKAPRKPRGPLTTEQKISRKQRDIAKAQAALDALLAEQLGTVEE